MTPRHRRTFLVRLRALREQLVASGPKKIEPSRTDAAGAETADEDRQALTEMLQVLASSQNRVQAEILHKVDGALRRLAEAPEEYGVCEECGDDIPEPRLRVMPYATLCLEGQSERDPTRGAGRRSITDYR